MRRIATIIALLTLGCSLGVAADYKYFVLEATTGTNATALVTASDATINGYVFEVVFDCPSAVTGNVSVVAESPVSTVADVTLATATSDVTIRPLFDLTDTAGSAHSSGAGDYFHVAGETVTLSVTNASATNATFKAVVKYGK